MGLELAAGWSQRPAPLVGRLQSDRLTPVVRCLLSAVWVVRVRVGVGWFVVDITPHKTRTSIDMELLKSFEGLNAPRRGCFVPLWCARVVRQSQRFGVRHTTTMQDPHPLAIIPLQKNLLPSADTSTSSSNSVGSSPNSSTPGANANSPLVPIRALVAHKGTAAAGTAAAGLDESVRSEDDAALMRSLISLLPHERADSQVLFLLCTISSYSSTSLCCRIHCGSNVPHSAHTERPSPLLVFRTRNEGRYSLDKRPMSPVRARPAPAPKTRS